MNESYFLFLKNTSSGPEVLIGYLGALKIKDGVVTTDEVRGEPKTQSIEVLLEQVRKLISK